MKLATQCVSQQQLVGLVTDCLIIFSPAEGLEDHGARLPNALLEHIKGLCKKGDFHDKSKYLLTVETNKISADRILLVNTNNIDAERSLALIATDIMAELCSRTIAHCALCIVDPRMPYERLSDALLDASYQNCSDKTAPLPRSPNTLNLLYFATQTPPDIHRAHALHLGMTLTKDLANMPGNHCTPSYLAKRAQQLAAQFDALHCEVIDEAALTQLGMNAYLAVGQGSHEQSCMPIVHYKGGKSGQAPICIIGKGVTFDSGGITLKKPPGMHNMIYDMCGAATVLGIMATVAELQLPLNLIGIVATAENMPDGKAFRPGDVLTTLSGQTVEIISTDAEGRLLLGDAISYAQRFNPSCIVDIATLTGAQIVTLGHHASGLMGNCDALTQALQQAGDECGDRAWTMPLWDEYQDTLASECADMRNAGTQSPGMITAGCYLSRFANATPWAHLDTAGTSFTYGKGNSATGRPLPLLLKFLHNCCQANSSNWSI